MIMVSLVPCLLDGRRNSRTHFAVTWLPYGHFLHCIVATRHTDTVSVDGRAERNRRQMEPDQPVLARLQPEPVQRTAPPDARDFTQGPRGNAPQSGARGAHSSDRLCGGPATGRVFDLEPWPNRASVDRGGSDLGTRAPGVEGQTGRLRSFRHGAPMMYTQWCTT